MRNTEEFNRRYVRESLYEIELQHTHSFIFIPSPIVARRKTLYGVSKQNTYTYMYRESPPSRYSRSIFSTFAFITLSQLLDTDTH